MKWNIIGLITSYLSIRQIRFTFPSLENIDYVFKWTFHAIKSPINEISGIAFSFRDQKKDTKLTFFSLLDAKEF